MLKFIRTTAGLFALVVTLTAAVPEDTPIFGLFDCCVGEVCEPKGCLFRSDCLEDRDCIDPTGASKGLR